MNRGRLLLLGGAILATILVVSVARIAMKHTRYAPGFSERAFENVSIGASMEQVIAALGEPLSRRVNQGPELWCYGNRPAEMTVESKSHFFWSEHRIKRPPGPPCVVFNDAGRVVEAVDDQDGGLASVVGKSKDEVIKTLGEPKYTQPAYTHTVLYYSGPDGQNVSFDYHAVVFDEQGHVIDRFKDTVWD